MSTDHHRKVGFTGARFGRIERDIEPEGTTDSDTAAPAQSTPEPPTPEPPGPDQDDRTAPAGAEGPDDVDDLYDLPQPVGARFARPSRESRRSRRAARRSASATPAPAASPLASLPPAPLPGALQPAAPQPAMSPPATPQPAAPQPAMSPPADQPEPAPSPIQPEPETDESAGLDRGVSVRPYIHTGGRTRSRLPLSLETLVTAVPGAPDRELLGAHLAVVELCRASQSVAELSARLAVPLGVARVLVDDLAAEHAVIVHGETVSDTPNLELMGRVLAGLRRL